MREPFDPRVATEKASDSYPKTVAQFEELAQGTEVPEGMRLLAERNITQLRET